MKLTTTLAAIALTATQALATPYIEPPQEPKEPPIVTHDGGGVDVGAVLAIILGVAVARELLADKPDPLSTPRPLVWPQTCMNKLGVIVACEGE